jgi:hypothetical protein
MKMNKLALAALAATAVSVAAGRAHAQVASANDLIFGVQDLNGNGASGANDPTDLEVDLGSVSAFESGGADATGSAVTLSNVTINDLTTIYNANGGNWADTNFGVDWSVAGATSTTGIFLDTSSDSSVNQIHSNSSYNLVAQLYQGMDGTNATALSDTNGKGVSIGTSATPDTTINNSYASLDSGGGGFNAVSDESDVGAGSLNLYLIGGSGTKAQDLGTFKLSSSGVLTFTSVAPTVVPEPSTYALFISGALLLFLKLRRRKTVA